MNLQQPEAMTFEIRPTDPDRAKFGGVFGKGRVLMGRTDNCDFLVEHDSISAIHAVLEIFTDHAVLYDMNSTNGTYVNDEKIIAKQVHPGDFFRLADIEFEFVVSTMPPVLKPWKAGTRTDLSRTALDISHTPQVFPAVEVTILQNDEIHTAFNLPQGRETYYLTDLSLSPGSILKASDKDKSEFPLLVTIQGNRVTVHDLPGFSVFHLSDQGKSTTKTDKAVDLKDGEIVRLQKDQLQIFIRNISSTVNSQKASKINLYVILICLVGLIALFWYFRKGN